LGSDGIGTPRGTSPSNFTPWRAEVDERRHADTRQNDEKRDRFVRKKLLSENEKPECRAAEQQ
jgi:hypothetical protein